jgi:hypothetical protein
MLQKCHAIQTLPTLQDFRFQSSCKGDLCPSEILRSVDGKFLTVVSEHPSLSHLQGSSGPKELTCYLLKYSPIIGWL